MTKRVINQVVDYLTIVTEDRIYQILPIEVLLRQHTPPDVVGFLNLLRQDYKKELQPAAEGEQDPSEDQFPDRPQFPHSHGDQDHSKIIKRRR